MQHYIIALHAVVVCSSVCPQWWHSCEVKGVKAAISLTPNNVWVMWCWCFSPALRSIFSCLKWTKMQNFDQKNFPGYYPRTYAVEGGHPSTTFSVPAPDFWPPIFLILCHHCLSITSWYCTWLSQKLCHTIA